MTAARLRMAALLVGLAGPGAYLFIYLYRWEWHRALVAGLFVIAAEVALGIAMVLERLRALERRLDGAVSDGHKARATAPVTAIEQRLRETAPPPSQPFAWLGDNDRLGVFVPLLLGAGVVMSALAWAVERLARATARPALEHGLGRRLAPLAIAPGVLQTPWPGAAAPGPAHRIPRLAVRMLLAAAVALALIKGVDALGDASQNRPDRIDPATSSAVLLLVSGRDPAATTEHLANRMWGACASQLHHSSRLEGLTVVTPGHAVLVVSPGIGEYAARRFQGCLSDVGADGAQGRVVSITGP